MTRSGIASPIRKHFRSRTFREGSFNVRLQRQASRPGHGAGHLVREFRRELLGSNTLALQSAAISPNIGRRFLRRRDRVDQILYVGIS